MKHSEVSDIARILLIEDNAADVDLMKYALNKGNFRFELSTLRDGAEALAFIRKKGKYANAPQPDLIVMDLHLPKSDGMQVLEEIRRNPTFANLPVAVLSSSVSQEDKNRIAALERTCFISKPLDLDGFMTVGTTIRKLSLEGKARTAAATF
jgi:CheY-like chemotaxis protein